jgi:hypothetical protein
MNFPINLVTLLGAICLVLFAFVAAFEIALRIWRWYQRNYLYEEVRRHDFLSPGYHTYLNWIESWDKPMFQYLPIGLRHFNLDNPIPPVVNNRQGFRCPEFDDRDSDDMVVVLIGGSAAWGCGASSNEATIAGQLETIINADAALLGDYKRARVYNLAQVDSHQTQDLLTLVLFASRLRPQLVLSFTGWNEVACNGTMDQDILNTYGAFYLTEMEGWQPARAGNNAWAMMKDGFHLWGARKSALVSAILRRNAKPLNNMSRPIDDCVKIAKPIFLEHLQRIEELSTGFGFKHFQFMQPHLYRKLELTPEEAKVVELYDEVRPIQGGKETGDYLRTNNIFSDIVEDAQGDQAYGEIRDLSDLFLESKEWRFFSLVHFNDNGYRDIAQAMYKEVLESEWRPS